MRATIFVPKGVDQAKYRGMVAYGAEVKVVAVSRITTRLKNWRSNNRGRTDGLLSRRLTTTAVMAGNGGTLAAEIVDDLPDVENFIVPVGGGGLSAGLALLRERKSARRPIDWLPALK